MGSRTISLKGEAARAFVEGAMGKPLINTKTRKELSIEDKYLAIATRVTVYMKSGTKADAKVATAILAQLETQGLEETFKTHRGG